MQSADTMAPTAGPASAITGATGRAAHEPLIAERGWLAAAVTVGLAVLVIGIVLPIVSLLGMSLFARDGSFAGLANFQAYLGGPNVWASVVNSVSLAALSAIVCVTLAYGYAFALTHTCMAGRRVFRGIALVPLLAPSLLMAISLVYLFGNQGLLKGALFGQPAYGPWGIVVGSVLWTFPHALLILTTALATSDARLYEAAESLGANRWRMFRTVTLPASRYGIVISTVVVFVLVVTDFGVPKVIGGNTPMLSTDIYKQVIGQQNLPLGAVVALLLLVPAALAFWIEQRLRARQHASLGVRAVVWRPKPHAALDRTAWLYCSVIAVVLLAVMGTAVFASLATYWPYQLTPTLKHYRFDLTDGGGWASYFNSLRMAMGAAVLGALLSFVTAYLVDKPRDFGPARRLINAIATVPMAVPGLALGLGYILFFNAPWNPLHGLYGGMTILVLCTVAHFFSVAHITQLTALRQLDAEYEHVGRSLGVPFWRTCWRVHLPVSLPATLQVAGYFFVNALTTVSAVVFLYSPQTTLAAVAVLDMDDAGDTAAAAAMATLIFFTAAAGRLAIAALEYGLVARTQGWRTS